MEKTDFLSASKNIIPPHAAFKMVANPHVWEILNYLFHDDTVQARLGLIDTHKRFVEWIEANPGFIHKAFKYSAYQSQPIMTSMQDAYL